MVKRLLLGVITSVACSGIALGLVLRLGVWLFGWNVTGVSSLSLVPMGMACLFMMIFFENIISKYVLRKGDLEELADDAKI